MKTVLIVAGVAAVFLLGGAWLSRELQSSDSTVISRSGIHWHPELHIYVNGEQIEIPANVGLGVTHEPIHTHEDLPLLHLEFDGLVRENDILLGRFFEIWGRDMRSFGSLVRITVNGEENTEYENYPMHDGDVIELYYDEVK